MRIAALFLTFSLFFISCNVTKTTTDFENTKKELISKTWLLQDENGTVVSYNGQEVSIQFEKEETGLRASGFSGCNRFFSNVDFQPESIKFNGAGSTMMACPDMDGESAFLDLINKVNAYEISANELKLFQNKILLLRFKSK